jgi:sulfhydrogenase subunit beta (sulfur reductase)
MTSLSGFLTEESWKAFMDKLIGNYVVYAPRKQADVIVFMPLASGEFPCLDRPAVASPKAFFLPQSEELFCFSMVKNKEQPQKAEIVLEENFEAPDTVIVGLRPCDAKGLACLDAVFYEKDPYFRNRRDHTVLIAFACERGYSGCFCTSVGVSPADRRHSDVLVTFIDVPTGTSISSGYYVEALTEKGTTVLAYAGLTESDSHRNDAEKRHFDAESRIKKVFEGGKNVRIVGERFDSAEFWDMESEKCVSCGACTYLCPTCYCFNITDEMAINGGARIRSWDSCMFAHYTQETSGHNPREKKSQRLKNRIGHKFAYYPEIYGDVLCSGCGRCIRHCPVSVDISRIVSSLSEMEVVAEKEDLRG